MRSPRTASGAGPQTDHIVIQGLIQHLPPSLQNPDALFPPRRTPRCFDWLAEGAVSDLGTHRPGAHVCSLRLVGLAEMALTGCNLIRITSTCFPTARALETRLRAARRGIGIQVHAAREALRRASASPGRFCHRIIWSSARTPSPGHAPRPRQRRSSRAMQCTGIVFPNSAFTVSRELMRQRRAACASFSSACTRIRPRTRRTSPTRRKFVCGRATMRSFCRLDVQVGV